MAAVEPVIEVGDEPLLVPLGSVGRHGAAAPGVGFCPEPP
jgi:hypothetical protein